MKPCTHSQWLRLKQSESEFFLLETDILSKFVDQISRPYEQQPSLLVFIGGRAKSLALGELLSSTKVCKAAVRRGHGELHLHIDPSSIFHDRPIMIADGELRRSSHEGVKRLLTDCHEVTSHILPRVREGVHKRPLDELVDLLYSRLLGPFADAFCIFTSDFRTYGTIVKHVAAWLEKGRASTLPRSTYPQLILVADADEASMDNEIITRERFLDMLSSETTKELSERFSAISVVRLSPKGQVSSQARHSRLKDHLLNCSDVVRAKRIESKTYFTMHHFTAFFRLACKHFARTTREPFDFIKESRLQSPVSPELQLHLHEFLQQFRLPEGLRQSAIPLVASSFLLDNYMPGMHPFRSSDVFQTLYRHICHEVGRSSVLSHAGSRSMMLPTAFVRQVETEFGRLVQELETSDHKSSADIHERLISENRVLWHTVRTKRTCLPCIRRRPQYSFLCQHAVCEICATTFGFPSRHDPWLFEIPTCLLCGVETNGVAVRVKPANAGVRVLSIDGGGVRGIIPLQFLQELQDRVGLPSAIQDSFDLVVATSSGGLITLGLCMNGWTVDDCIKTFEDVAQRAFQHRTFGRIPFLSWVKELFVSYLADSLYPADRLEGALQEVFGQRTSIHECSHATRTGTMVSLPVTTIPRTSSCLFTNYNGVGSRAIDCGKSTPGKWDTEGNVDIHIGYQVVGANEEGTETRIWEVARCVSAAPWFFPPKEVKGIGTFQDGGLWRNNPVEIALWEMRAIWPTIDEADLVVSLGTGYARDATEPHRPMGPRGIWRDGFIPRTYRAFLSSLSGRKLWQEFRNRRKTGSDARLFRFDVAFDSEEPNLDDINRMQELKDQARKEARRSKELDELARSLVASLFYFELDAVPSHEKGRKVCSGRILCRWRVGYPAFEPLMDQLGRGSAKFVVNGRPLTGRVDDRTFVDREGNFRKTVELKVDSLKEEIVIEMCEGNFKARHISGSPLTLGKMIREQGLDAPFGRADIRKRGCDGLQGTGARKRARRSL